MCIWSGALCRFLSRFHVLAHLWTTHGCQTILCKTMNVLFAPIFCGQRCFLCLAFGAVYLVVHTNHPTTKVQRFWAIKSCRTATNIVALTSFTHGSWNCCGSWVSLCGLNFNSKPCSFLNSNALRRLPVLHSLACAFSLPPDHSAEQIQVEDIFLLFHRIQDWTKDDYTRLFYFGQFAHSIEHSNGGKLHLHWLRLAYFTVRVGAVHSWLAADT